MTYFIFSDDIFIAIIKLIFLRNWPPKFWPTSIDSHDFLQYRRDTGYTPFESYIQELSENYRLLVFFCGYWSVGPLRNIAPFSQGQAEILIKCLISCF